MIEHPALTVDDLRADLRQRTLNEAVERLLERLGRGGQFDFAALWGPDDRIERLRPVSVWQAVPGAFPAFTERTRTITFRRGEGLLGRVWATGESVWSDDLRAEPGYLASAVVSGDGAASGVVFPIAVGEKVVGVIELYSAQQRPLEAGLRQELSALAEELGPALSRRLGAEAVSIEQTRLEAALQAGDMGVWHWDLATNIITWSETVQAMIGRRGPFVGSVEDFIDVLHPDDSDRVLDGFRRAVEDVRHPEVNVRYRIRHEDGSVRWHETRGKAYRDADGELAAITGVVSDVTERVCWEDRVRRKSQLLEAVNEVSRAISAHLDLERIVQLLTDKATEVAGAQVGAFFYNVVDPSGESYMLYALSGAPREAFADFPMPRNTALFAPTFAGEAVVRLDDVSADERYGREAPHHGMPEGHVPVCSYLAVPVVGGDEVHGGLFLGHEEPGRFSEHEEEAVVGIAAQAAVAIGNARLYREALDEAAARQRAFEERDRVARVLQESLLPHQLPTSPVLEFGARYLARTGLVGGDLYDVFPVGLDRWGLVVGDVCGKGPEAAAVTALVRYAVRSTATIVPEPREVLQFANDTLVRDATDRFCSATFGVVLGAADGEAVLHIAQAGHPPALVVRSDGSVEAIDDSGTLLGVLARPRIAHATVGLRAGDAVVLYTDGVTDAKGVDQRFGFERLVARAGELAGRPAQEIADGIVDAIEQHAVGHFTDDVAVLTAVVRATPAG